MRRIMAFPVCFLCLWLCALPGWSIQNLLVNGDFQEDQDEDGVADGWTGEVHRGAEGRFLLDERVRRSGVHAQRIDHVNEDPAWVRTSLSGVQAVPGAAYRAEIWVQATGPWQVLLYQFRQNGEYLTHYVGTGGDTNGEWVEVAGTYEADANATSFKLSLVVQGKGTAWFDSPLLFQVDGTHWMEAFPLRKEPFLDGQIEVSEGGDPFPLRRLDGKGERPERNCWAHLGLCGGGLYLGFRAEETQMGSRTVADAKGEASWADDSLEVFLMPPSGEGYYHMGVNPLGKKLCEFKPVKLGAKDWYSTGERTEKTLPPFQAVVGEKANEWTAELVLPMAEMEGPEGDSQGPWKLCVARSRKVKGVEENSSWPVLKGETFHRPEVFGSLLLRGANGSRIRWARAERASKTKTARLTPTVQKCSSCAFLGAKLSPHWRLSTGGLGRDAGEDWLEHMSRHWGYPLEKENLQQDTSLGGHILLGGPGEHPRLKRDWSKAERRLSDAPSWQKDQAYVLTVRPGSLRIAAQSPAGLHFGVQTLKQWMGPDRTLRRCRILDWPQMHWRAWHLIAPETPQALEEAHRLVDVFGAFKFNVLAIQIDNRLQYESNPDLSRTHAPSKAELSALVAHAESLGMEVIPMTQCWSHFNYFLSKPQFRQLAEIPEPKKDQKHKFWNYCPRHPEVHDLLFQMIEEQLECFPHAKYLHVGLDEITFEPIAVCERCKSSEPHEVFTEEVKRLHAFAESKGLRMCMWGDQLLPGHSGGPPYYTGKAIDDIPKDILIFDWHYGGASDFPSVAFFQDKGFEVLGCGWYEPLNVMNFSDVCFRENCLGYSGTSWWRMDRFIDEPRLMAAVSLAGENSWSPGTPTIENIGWEAVHRFREIYDLMRPLKRPNRFALMDLSGKANGSLRNIQEAFSCVNAGRYSDYSDLRPGVNWVNKIPFLIMESKGPAGRDCILLTDDETASQLLPQAVRNIPVGTFLSRVAFLHSCTRPRQFTRHIYDRERKNPGLIAQYEVVYADGSRERLPLRWNREMSDWNSQLGAALASGGWTGETRAGELIRLDRYVWENPHPEKLIVAIDMESCLDQVRPYLVAVTGIVDR